MKRLFTFFLISSLFAFTGNLFAQNLITNGGFEAGNFSGWTLSGDTDPDTSYTNVCQSSSGDVTCSGRVVHSGDWMASFGPLNTESLSQSVATNAGGNYVVSFWLQNGNSPNDFSVSFNGVTLTSLHDSDAFGWTFYSFVAGATTSSTALQFNFEQPADYFDLDDVTVVQTPEPASLALLFSGLSLGAGALRKFRS